MMKSNRCDTFVGCQQHDAGLCEKHCLWEEWRHREATAIGHEAIPFRKWLRLIGIAHKSLSDAIRNNEKMSGPSPL